MLRHMKKIKFSNKCIIVITESSTGEATFIEIKFANVSIGYTANLPIFVRAMMIIKRVMSQ